MEGIQKAGTFNGFAPTGWLDCSHTDQTSVDIQPNQFKVTTPPKEGKTYVGMVVRADETWEGISQRLSRPLIGGKCYNFSIYLARSDIYLSRTQGSEKLENFANPTKLRIYASRGYCGKTELLAESNLVAHSDWRKYDFRFEPTANYTYILFEVFYKTPSLFLYNGNLIIDDLSDIYPIPCDEEQVVEEEKNPPIVNILSPAEDGEKVSQSLYAFKAKLANVPSKSNLKLTVNNVPKDFTFNSSKQMVTADLNLEQGQNLIRLSAKTADGASQERRRIYYDPPVVYSAPEPKPFKPKVLVEFGNRNNLKEGKVLRLTRLYFQADSSKIEKENYYIVEELHDFLVANPDIEVEIMGHTNNRCDKEVCDKLAQRRAKAVVDYLVHKGIDRNRLTYQGYGKDRPVATNQTASGRRRNQRVEVKITKISSS